MRTVQAVDVYETDEATLLAPWRKDEEGVWARTGDFVVVPRTIPAGDLGRDVRTGLERSREAIPTIPDRVAESERVTAARIAAAGLPDLASFVASTRWVLVARGDDDALAIVHSDAHGGEQPGFRQYTAYTTLRPDDDEQLGEAVRTALDRCTRSDEP